MQYWRLLRIAAVAMLLLPSACLGQMTRPHLVSPAGGETWSAGSSHRITWRAPSAVQAVGIEWSTDGGATWAPIAGRDGVEAVVVPSAAGIANSFIWKVPEAPGTRFSLRIINAEDPTMTDQNTGGITVGPSAEVAYKWICATENAAFAPRDGAGMIVYRDAMWLLGGWNPRDKVNFPSICNSEVWRSTDGAEWAMINKQAPWEGRHTAGYANHDGKMWIVGGDCNQGRYQNDVWTSEDGVEWTLVNDSVPWGPRALHHTVVFDGYIWVMGGQTLPQFAPAEQRYYSDVWRSRDGVEWEMLTDRAPWGPRGMIGGNVVLHGRMWLLGGGTYDTPSIPTREFHNDVWSSADGVEWECHTEAAPWAPRQYHEVAAFDGRMWVMEGYLKETGNRKDVWYSADGVNWYEVPDTPWLPRHAASVFVYDGGLWMVAGNNMTPDAWKLTRAE